MRSQLSLHQLTHAGGCEVETECENELPCIRCQTKPVGIQPAMDGLETVVDNAECFVSAESDV